MRNYYYLISSLPELELEGHKKFYPYEESLQFIKSNLHQNDSRLLNYFLYPADIKNIANFLAEKRALEKPYPFIIQPGTIELSDIKEIWEKGTDNPPFLKMFFEQNINEKDQLPLPEIEKLLLELFYRSAIQEEDVFVSSWFHFELHLKNIIAISNSRKFDLELKHLLLKEFETNDRNIEDFAYQSLLDELHSRHEENNPVLLEKLLDKIKWKFLDKISSFSFFNVHAVFAWFLKLQILTRWTGEWSREDSEKKLIAMIENATIDFSVDEFRQ